VSDKQPLFDLPPEAYPFTVEFLRSDTKEVVHTIHVPGPGAVTVPGLRQQYGVEMEVRVTYADGEVSESK